MAFTKEQLAKLGITIEEDSIEDDKAFELIEKHTSTLTSEKAKLKKRTDELSSEIAEKKKAEQEKMSEEEKTRLHYEEIENANKELTRQLSRNNKINDLMSIGYDKELATKYAEAELDGKSTIEFQKQFMNSKLEAQKQELLKGTPTPRINTDGDDKGKFTKENFKAGKISMEEMNKLKESDPATYNELIKD
jgi:hypothetical protein